MSNSTAIIPDIVELMIEKELRVRTPLEELELLMLNFEAVRKMGQDEKMEDDREEEEQAKEQEDLENERKDREKIRAKDRQEQGKQLEEELEPIMPNKEQN